MKILIIDLCNTKFPLSKYEFIKPICDIIKKNYKIVHYKEVLNLNINDYNKVILSGSNLSDFESLENIEYFKWINKYNGDLLGICAGAQVLGNFFKCKIENITEIGLINLKIIKNNDILNNVDFSEVYCIHKKSIKPNNFLDIIAISDNCVEMFKIKNKNFYGVLFHPEVRNKKLIKNFIKL